MEEDIVAILTPVWILAVLMPVLLIIIILGHREKMAKLKSQAAASEAQTKASLNEFAQRLEKIERRIANLETIVLEAEKAKNFDRSL